MQEMKEKETWVRPLGWEDPLEEEMANHSSVLAWKIPWTEEPGGLQSMGLQRVGHNLATEQQQQQAKLGGKITVFGNFYLSMNLSQIPK